MEQMQRAMLAGVIFQVLNMPDGTKPLFVWHRDRDDDEESSVGFDTLREAVTDACAELKI